MIDRTEMSRYLTKSLAYAFAGKMEEARGWAAKLVAALKAGGLI